MCFFIVNSLFMPHLRIASRGKKPLPVL